MKTISTLIIVLLSPLFCLAQSNTHFMYLSKDGRETTKDSAYSYIKFSKHSDLWLAQEYYSESQSLKSEGTYREKNLQKPLGVFNAYTEDGALELVTEFDDFHNAISKTYYYTNGNKKREILYRNNIVIHDRVWNEAGKEIRPAGLEKRQRLKASFVH